MCRLNDITTGLGLLLLLPLGCDPARPGTDARSEIHKYDSTSVNSGEGRGRKGGARRFLITTEVYRAAPLQLVHYVSGGQRMIAHRVVEFVGAKPPKTPDLKNAQTREFVLRSGESGVFGLPAPLLRNAVRLSVGSVGGSKGWDVQYLIEGEDEQPRTVQVAEGGRVWLAYHPGREKAAKGVPAWAFAVRVEKLR